MTIRKKSGVGILLLALALPVFSQTQERKKVEVPAAPPAKVEDAELRKSAGAPVDPKTYMIGAEDILQVRVWREPDFSGPVSVRPDGKITLVLGGEIQASGLTPEQLGKKITEVLSNYINRPQVTVMVQAVLSKKYLISGEVNRPGPYPLVVPTTVVEALTQAGGFREFANLKRIIIIRGLKRLFFNYRDYIKGKNPGQNILLENGDHIVVE